MCAHRRSPWHCREFESDRRSIADRGTAKLADTPNSAAEIRDAIEITVADVYDETRARRARLLNEGLKWIAETSDDVESPSIANDDSWMEGAAATDNQYEFG